MAKLSLKDFYNSLVKFVDNNPDVVTNIGIAAPVVIKLIKSGALTKIIQQMFVEMKAGFGAKEALGRALTSNAVKSGIAKTGKGLAIAAAAAFALGTIKEAIKGGKVAIEEDEPGWKKIVDFAWNTSIPGATVNQFRAFGKWLTKKPSESKDSTKQLSGSEWPGHFKTDAQVEIKEGVDGRTIVRTPIVTPKESGRQVVEHERNKATQSIQPKTTSDKLAEYVERRGRNMGTNDPKWYYSGIYNAIKYAGEYSFDIKNGEIEKTPFPSVVTTSPLTTRKAAAPSMGSIDLILTLGKTTEDMLFNMYNDLTIKIKALNKNSALTTTWTKSDLYKLVHTMRVLYAGWLMGRRAYKLVNEFSGDDLTLPYATFAAIGMDYDSWRDARAQIQEDLLNLSSMLDTYIDWTKLDLFKRTEQLFEYGYKDGKSVKAQAIFFTMSSTTHYYRFISGSWQPALFSDQSVALSSGTGLTYTAWKNMFTAIIDGLRTSKVQDMLSCLRFVFGAGKASLFDVPKPQDKVKFLWDPEMQAQIENATLVHVDATTYTIADDATADWVTETVTYTGGETKYYNSHLAQPSKEEQVVATRLTAAHLDNEWYFGTELPRALFIYVAQSNASMNIKSLSRNEYYNDMHLDLYSTGSQDAGNADLCDKLIGLAILNSFDWAPHIEYDIYVGTIDSQAIAYNVKEAILNADWESRALMFDKTVNTALTYMSYLRNGNYGLHSRLQTRINEILEKAKTA